jgi:hypothetical protein
MGFSGEYLEERSWLCYFEYLFNLANPAVFLSKFDTNPL